MSEEQIERRFGKPRMSGRMTHYVKDDGYLTVFKFVDGTRALQGGTLEMDGEQIASADGSVDLESMERILGYRSRKIAEEKNVTWYRFDQHKVDVGIGHHGSMTGKATVFALQGK